MKRLLAVLLLVCAACLAEDLSEAEKNALGQALSEAGSSPIELIRAMEAHLAKFPESPKRFELERALVKAAIEAHDERRIILYGERTLKREQEDMQILDRVARALLSSEEKESAGRALNYAHRYEELVKSLREQPVGAGRQQWREEVDRGLARSLSLQARATGILGEKEQAIAIAQQAYAAYPSSEAAREVARWFDRSGKPDEAISYLADAFNLDDASDKAADRTRLNELYARTKNKQKSLGDIILASYDRTVERQSSLKEADPNAKVAKALDFTLSALKGSPLQLASLRGKAIVFDFWATWCGPCRAQHPLYEEVKTKYRFNPDVVFLAVNTDEDRSLVEPFLKEQKWSQNVYFEDGMARKLNVSSIPTTLVVNRDGEIISRLNGFVPSRFVEMLSERIEEALK